MTSLLFWNVVLSHWVTGAGCLIFEVRKSLGILAPEHENATLSRNVGYNSSTDLAPHPRKVHKSTDEMQKGKER